MKTVVKKVYVIKFDPHLGKEFTTKNAKFCTTGMIELQSDADEGDIRSKIVSIVNTSATGSDRVMYDWRFRVREAVWTYIQSPRSCFRFSL